MNARFFLVLILAAVVAAIVATLVQRLRFPSAGAAVSGAAGGGKS